VSLSFREGACLACRRQGLLIGFKCRYQNSDASSFGVNLPYVDGLSLGEGRTSVTRLSERSESLGLAALDLKDESRNPSGSHKDRMMAVAVNYALDIGAHTLLVASSGHAAISAALYAGSLGLKCEIVSLPGINPRVARTVTEWGATLITCSTEKERQLLMRQRTQRPGFFSLDHIFDHGIGSASVAVEGYKAIAQECFEAAKIPDHLVIPCGKGDLAWGVFAGFAELKEQQVIERIPRLWIVEPYPRLSSVLTGEKITKDFRVPTRQASLVAGFVSYAQVQSVKESNGGAIAIDDPAALRAQKELRESGFNADLGAASAYAALQQLRKVRAIREGSFVTLLLTAQSSD
jgi:threonine synthase